MKFLILTSLLLNISCSMLSKNEYTSACEKLVHKLQGMHELKIVKGYGQVISTDHRKLDHRTDSAGDHAFFERAKSDMLQKLYRDKSTIDLTSKDATIQKAGKALVESRASETADFTSEKMVTIYCGGSVYGVVGKKRFE